MGSGTMIKVNIFALKLCLLALWYSIAVGGGDPQRQEQQEPAVYSTTPPSIPQKTPADLKLSTEERLAIYENWQKMAKDLQGNGVKFLLLLMSAVPDIKNLFPKFSNVPFHQLSANENFRAQALLMFTNMNDAIGLMDDLEELKSFLLNVGETHVPRKATLRHCQNVRETMIKFLARELPPQKFTPVAQSGWTKFMTWSHTIVWKGLETWKRDNMRHVRRRRERHEEPDNFDDS